MAEEHDTVVVIVTSMLDGTDTVSIYNSIYLTFKTLVEKLIDMNFLYDGLYEEFSSRNNITGEKFEIPEGYECPVCYVDGHDSYFKFGCNHIVCAKCFASLLINDHTRCPLCREDVVFENCKINKKIENPLYEISEEEIENITAEYVNDYIFNIHSSSLW